MTRHLYEQIFNLQGLGIALGLLLLGTHLFALLQPARTMAFLKIFPRQKEIGIALMAVNFLWWFWIISNVDLGEFYTVRKPLQMLLPVMFVLVVVFVDEFLAARALGFFMLLLACPFLDVAFQKPHATRLLIPIICYVWIGLALFWVGMPYLLRDQIAWVSASIKRWRGVAMAGVIYGALVLGCALAFWKGL
ncbi:MAG: hypothetical protein ACI8XO_000612 [Verrucomicrobiales bacterium]|jgi:hypothetical protein